MTYSLDFDARALKEWQKLGDTLRQQLKKKLVEILNNPATKPIACMDSLTATRSNYAVAVTG
ncbi:mRNA interferase RelE [Pseudomonas sp. 37 R 15]|nr:mRNA interferase RelE [Pseudomonas sp. 37 R 15]